MIFQCVSFRVGLLVTCGLFSLGSSAAQTTAHKAQQAKTSATSSAKSYSAELVKKGNAQFQQDCSFCHGRDAMGGETGPDLTRSKLVAADVDGDKIGPVVLNGRPDKGMPRFDRSEQQIASLAAFIHIQQYSALTRKGGRKGV